MTRRFRVGLACLLADAALTASASAQPLGTFRWQLQPFCNVVTVAVTQNGAVYRLEGTDDQCGNGADAASVTGTAFPNPDGTIGFGLNVVTAPGGRPLHVDAEINVGTFSGTWRDSAGATGTFVLTSGAANGGIPRPLPLPVVPTSERSSSRPIQLRGDGGFVAAGALDEGTIPASGPGVRTMWYPGKASFRAGEVLGSEWDDANVGFYSVALGFQTMASGVFSTALGVRTTANASASTALGNFTTASGGASTALGFGTTASSANALAGGRHSVASGGSALAFGVESRAVGDTSVALGTRAVADSGSFVFADGASTSGFGSGVNQFFVRASGGVAFFSNPTSTTGVRLAAGGSQWLTISDVRTKHHFRELDGDDVLARIGRMPVTEWSYLAQDDAIRHIGPTAQDFHAAFGLGEDPLRIGTLDADGVALAGVKALEARTRHHATSLDVHGEELASLKAEVARLRALVLSLTGSPR
jgi:trimeric autotransporter adhesin